tara:strand:- start:2984 stop:3313 length:330 start_codon:yes stop_codon:yes gene_type:complete
MAEIKTLKSGITITIKDMSIDEMDDCRDSIDITFADGQPSSIKNVNKTRTKWLRAGLSGIGDWKAVNGEMPPDSALKQLTDEDKQEASDLIQAAQVVTRKKQPASPSTS